MPVLVRLREFARAGLRWRPRTYWQAWLRAAALPLALLALGLCLRLIFHDWPQFSGSGSVGAVGYIALRGWAESRGLRRRRQVMLPQLPLTDSR